MCRMNFLISLWFLFGFLKKLGWLQFGMSLVRLKKMRFGSDIVVIYYSCNSKYYSDSG